MVAQEVDLSIGVAVRIVAERQQMPTPCNPMELRLRNLTS